MPQPALTATATWPRLAALLLCGLTALPSQAQLFGGDDEARRAILDLRQKVETNRLAAEAAQQSLVREVRDLVESGNAPMRRSLLDLVNQIEALRAEVAALRGQNEQLSRDVTVLQQNQKDSQVAYEERLRAFEPVKVTVDGVSFAVQPAEKSAFETAMELLRAGDFDKAARSYQQFIDRYPQSGYVPVALYWKGNAQYASRQYREAIDSYQLLIRQTPRHLRVPEARLAIANCQFELKEAKAAKATLQELVKLHPDTEAGVTAKDRLSRLK